MIRSIAISVLSTLSISSLVAIPVSNWNRHDAMYEDGALVQLASRGSEDRNEFFVRGCWTSFAIGPQDRLIMGVGRGRACVSLAKQLPKPPVMGSTGFYRTWDFFGICAARSRPNNFRTCGTALQGMTIEERERYNRYQDSQNVEMNSLSLPLLMLTGIFGLFPSYAFVAGPWRRILRRRRGLCVNCGYNLAGNTTGTCPECGTNR